MAPEQENNTPAEIVKNYVAEYFSIEPEELLTAEVEKESPIYFVRVKDREVDREWIFGCTDRLIAEVLRDKHPHLNISDIPGILSEDTDTTLGIRNDVVKAVLQKVDYIRATIYSTRLDDESVEVEELGMHESSLVKVSKKDGEPIWKNTFGDADKLHKNMVGGMKVAFYGVNEEIATDPVLVVL